MSCCKIVPIEAEISINCHSTKKVFLHLPLDDIKVISDFNNDFSPDFGTSVTTEGTRFVNNFKNSIKSWLTSRS